MPELPKEMQLCPSSYVCRLNQILCVYFIFLIFVFFPTRHGNNGSPRLSEYIPVGSELKELKKKLIMKAVTSSMILYLEATFLFLSI